MPYTGGAAATPQRGRGNATPTRGSLVTKRTSLSRQIAGSNHGPQVGAFVGSAQTNHHKPV